MGGSEARVNQETLVKAGREKLVPVKDYDEDGLCLRWSRCATQYALPGVGPVQQAVYVEGACTECTFAVARAEPLHNVM